jgi:hypothetical protein
VAGVADHREHPPFGQERGGRVERRERRFGFGRARLVGAGQVAQIEHHRAHPLDRLRRKRLAHPLVAALHERHPVGHAVCFEPPARGVERLGLYVERPYAPGGPHRLGQKGRVVPVARRGVDSAVARTQRFGDVVFGNVEVGFHGL